MKKLLVLLLPICFFTASAQTSTDAVLNSRLKDYFALSKNLDFARTMDYMHPRLFSIVPKAQLIATMEAAFNMPEMKISFDSMSVLAISPLYRAGTATYRRVDYFMAMQVALGDSINLENPQVAQVMLASFQKGFPGKKVTLQTAANRISIAGKDLLFAIKDPQVTEWMFLGYDRSNPQLSAQLFPKTVRQHFKLQ